MAIDFLFDGKPNAAWTIALAHGAGAGMDSPFMAWFATSLAQRGVRVARFEFPYMAKRRRSGKRGPPDKLPVLLQTWREVIDALGRDRLVIGGKSMGGRIASMVADEARVKGLVCLGYRFIRWGNRSTRDPFGSEAEAAGYQLSAAIELHWLNDGDHDFKPRKASGRTLYDHWLEAADSIGAFLARIDATH
jgi:uncharacterized protein